MSPNLLKVMESHADRERRLVANTPTGSRQRKKGKAELRRPEELFRVLAGQESLSASLRRFRVLAQRDETITRARCQLMLRAGKASALKLHLDRDNFFRIEEPTTGCTLFCMSIDSESGLGEWTWLQAGTRISGSRVKQLALDLSKALNLRKLLLADVSAVRVPEEAGGELLMRVFRPILYGPEQASYYSSQGFRLADEGHGHARAHAAATASLQNLCARQIERELLAGRQAAQRRFRRICRSYAPKQRNCRLQDLALAVDAARRAVAPYSSMRRVHAANFAFLFQQLAGVYEQNPKNALQRQVSHDYAILEQAIHYELVLTDLREHS